jgi:hypothetical protein
MIVDGRKQQRSNTCLAIGASGLHCAGTQIVAMGLG